MNYDLGIGVTISGYEFGLVFRSINVGLECELGFWVRNVGWNSC